MTTGEQSAEAAERSASLQRGVGAKDRDSRPAYAVEVLDTQSQVIRRWHCRLAELPIGYAVRIRPLASP